MMTEHVGAQVKRMLSAVGGHGVRNLHRESFGPLCLVRNILRMLGVLVDIDRCCLIHTN